MNIPDFNEDGDLPPGVYRASLTEVIERFGIDTMQRLAVTDRLQRIYELAKSTGELKRFVVFGSFVTSKAEPNDVDIVMVMEDTFNLSAMTGEVSLVFHHLDAENRFGASIFWTTVSGALGGEQAMIEYWQIRRDGRQRGIVEIA